jgi:hypothetical protein
MGRKALMIVEDNYVCHDLNIRGHGHVLAVVRKYEVEFGVREMRVA